MTRIEVVQMIAGECCCDVQTANDALFRNNGVVHLAIGDITARKEPK